MHKTYLNSEEVKLIKGADAIIEKIGGFPSMENGKLVGLSVKRRLYGWDIELVFNINGWLNTLNYYNSCGHKESTPYFHKEFNERYIKIRFCNCHSYEIDGYGWMLHGEIKFGSKEQEMEENRHQDRGPGQDIIYERPYTCFYICRGDGLIIFFDEEECEISAELLEEYDEIKEPKHDYTQKIDDILEPFKTYEHYDIIKEGVKNWVDTWEDQERMIVWWESTAEECKDKPSKMIDYLKILKMMGGLPF